MPSYQVTGPDGKKYRVTVPEGATSAQAIQYVQDTYYAGKDATSETPEERTATGQFVRTAALGAAPAYAGMVGFGTGAAAGAELGAFGGPLAPVTVPVGTILGGLIGAGVAAYGAGKAQEKAIEAAPETARALGITPEQMAAGAEKHKTATAIGSFIPDIATFELGPERALLRALAEKETRAAAAKEIAKQTATNVGIMGAQDVATQALSDRPFDIKELGEAALTGAVLGRPRGWAAGAEAAGRRLGTPIAAGIEKLVPERVSRAAEEAYARQAERAAARAQPEEVPPEVAPEAFAEEAPPTTLPRDQVLSALSSEEGAKKSKAQLQEETGLSQEDLTGAIFTLKNEGAIAYDTRTKGWGLAGRPAEDVRVGEEAAPPSAGGGPELPVPLAEAREPSVAGPEREGLGAPAGPAVQPVGREEAVEPALAEAPKPIETPAVESVEAPAVEAAKPVEPVEAPAVEAAGPTELVKPEKTMEKLRSDASELTAKPGFVKRVIEKLPSFNYEKLVENVADSRRYLSKIQNDLKVGRKLVTVGEGKNNIADQISTAINRGVFTAHTEVDPVVRRLQNSIETYAKAANLPLKKAWERVSGYFIAQHEPLRRETKYLREVPLNNVIKDEFIPGEKPMTAAEAREVLEKRRSSVNTDAEAEGIRNALRDLAATHADPNGKSPTGARTTNINDGAFDVVGPEYSRLVISGAQKSYARDPNKALVDQVRKNLTDLHNVTKSLNRRANYWNDAVENYVKTYGWGDNYVPFKGMPGADRTLDSGVSYTREDLSKVPAGFEGKKTEFDDPILQSVADAYTASGRAGRGTDVTDTIKNLADMGVLTTKGRPQKYTFEQRNAPDFDPNKVTGPDKIVHYNKDGSVEVYSFADPRQIEAIKSVYREMNPILKNIGTLTRGIGLMHTRLNPNFAPKNFVRDTVTNTFLIAAKENPSLAAKYVGSVASHILNGGMLKAFRISKLLSGKTPEQLKELAKTADPTYRDAIEMQAYGGSSLYRKSFNSGEAMESLAKELGPNKIIKNKGQLTRWIDAWGDAFEMSARIGAYSARKRENIAKAEKAKLNLNDPKVMEDIKKEAAAFSLSLMDFGKVGKYGKELSALYMFTRPSATAAVNAIDALRPAFQFDTKKAFSKLEPEIQNLYETHTLAEDVKQMEQSKRPDEAKIAELKAEIARRQEAFDTFEKSHRSKQLNALGVAAVTTAAGYALYNMAAAMSSEDEQGRNRVKTDDMSRWTQNLRLPIPGQKDYIQVPWGFGVSALMAGGAQLAALQGGAVDFKDFAKNLVSIGADSFLPIPVSRIDPTENFGMWLADSAAPSIAKPYIEFLGNMNSFGTPIYNAQSGKYLDAFSGTARASDTHRAISQFMLDNLGVDMNPDTVSFLLNSYADGINSLAENSWNAVQVARGQKELDPRTDAFVLRGFIGTGSNYDARKFGEAEKKIQALQRVTNTYKDRGEYEKLQKFYENNPNAEALIATYNRGGEAALKQLYAARKKINQVKDISPKERKEYLDNVETSINYVKKNMVQRFEALGLK